MLSFRYLTRLLVAFFSRFKGLILVGVLGGIAIFILFNYIAPTIITTNTQIVGVSGRYHVEELPEDILDMVGEGLTTLDDEGHPSPSLASSWETPDKGKTWIFTLNTDKLWHDKTNLTSSDIVYNFSDVEVERPSDDKISFMLEEPYSPFPSVVSRPTFKQGLIGTGRWRVDEISLAGTYVEKLTLILDENTRKEKIIYRFYPTVEQTKLAYKLGEIDKIVNLLDPSPLDDWKVVNLETQLNKNLLVTIFFNNQDRLLSQKSARQALIYALDKNSFDGERAISPISSESWAHNPQVKKYTYDTQRAKELIDGLPQELKEDLNIKLVSTPSLLGVAENVAQQWREVGLETVVQVSSIVPEEYQAYITIFQLPKDPDQYALWHSTQTATNISNYSNPRIDKLLEDGRVDLQQEERYKIYLDFQRFLLEDIPAGFLYYPNNYTVERK
ncbi:MAG: ABC transporter substrate-binding protein [Candidatus Woesebacteria bacterium]|jgi:peptide/nickel transport system substrate-binding protein